MYKRLFTFGCSFTYYKWPTWADYLYAGRVSEEYQNWGLSGGSNDFIWHSITECDAANKITADDIVCIMWSQPHRIGDYSHDKGWDLPGSVFQFQPKERVMKYWDEDHSALQNLSYMHGAKTLLEAIGCEYKFFSMIKVNLRPDYCRAFNNVQRSISISMDEFLGYTPDDIRNHNWRETLPGDYHPSPVEHAQMTKSLEYDLDRDRIDRLARAADDYIFTADKPEDQIITVFPEKVPEHRLPRVPGEISGGKRGLVDVSTLQPFHWE